MSKSGIAALALALTLAAADSGRGQFYYGPYYNYGGAGGGGSDIDGITVTGKSTVMAKPDIVEIDLAVSSASELTADAIVKYRDARRKLHDAFDALKLKNISVEERGLKVDQKGQQYNPYYYNYSPNQRTKTEVQLSRKLVVRGKDLRKMDEDAVLQLVAKLLDVAQDAGGHVGPVQEFNPYYYRYNPQQNSLARFVIEDFDTLQEEAYTKAMANAKARAERLARLSEVKLGPVLAVRELIVPGDAPNDPNNASNDDDGKPRKRLETPRFQEIPVHVELLVRFAIQSEADKKGRADK